MQRKIANEGETSIEVEGSIKTRVQGGGANKRRGRRDREKGGGGHSFYHYYFKDTPTNFALLY